MDELDILKRVGSVAAPSNEALAGARQVFEDRAVGLDVIGSVGRRRWSRRRGLAGLAVGIGAAAALAVGVILPTGGVGHVHVGIDPGATAVLIDAARASTATPALLPAPGYYVYSETTDTVLAYGNGFGGNSATYWYRETQTKQTWTARDGSGRTLIGYSPAVFVSAASERAWRSSGQPLPTSVPADQSYGPSAQRASLNLDPNGLPTTPAALRAALAERYRLSTSALGLFSVGVSLLQEPGLQPTLRSSIYRMLSQTPGLSFYGAATNADGQSGQAVGLVASGVRVEMIFDVSTGRLIGEDRVVVDPAKLVAPPGETPKQLAALRDERVGTVLDARVFVTSKVVASTASGLQ